MTLLERMANWKMEKSMMKGLELKRKTKRLQPVMKRKGKKRRLTDTPGKDTRRPERRGGPKGGGATDPK